MNRATLAGKLGYEPGPNDEAFGPDGEPRSCYGALLGELGDPREIAARMAREAKRAGIRFGDGAQDAVHLDPVPRLISDAEWQWLQRGLEQRSRALNEFITDVYGERRAAAAGVVPARVIESADHFEPSLAGVDLGSMPAPIIGFDLVRGSDGRLRVLEDNLRTPSGVAYAIAVREVASAALPASLGAERYLDPGASLAALRELVAGAGAGAVLSDGPANSAWFEHEMLARELGVPLVAPDALSVRDGALLAGGDRLDWVYRRTDEDRLRDEDGRPTWLARLLAEPLRAGSLRVLNAPGGGVADDKLVHPRVEDLIRFYLSEEPVLGAVRTYDPIDPVAREHALQRLEELVVKPRGGYGGEGVVIGGRASDVDLERAREALEERPQDVIAQERVELSSHPTVIGDRLEPRRIDLRAFTVGGRLVPAPLTRVAMERGGMIVNSSQNGGLKDTWICAPAGSAGALDRPDKR